MSQEQFLDSIQNIIDGQVEIFNKLATATQCNEIPENYKIPIDPSRDGSWNWIEIPDLICVFVDMQGSTKLSAGSRDRTLASAYQLFTNTAIKIFHDFGTPYIDIKGDGVFALFNSNQVYRALCATVTFKTFVNKVFTPKMKDKTNGKIIGGHYGIDQKKVLVRKLGLRMNSRRGDIRQNEVWAGKPVNMAAKLASTAPIDTLWVSDRYFKNLKSDLALKSCGCNSEDEMHVDLWKPKDVSRDEELSKKGLDFQTVYELQTNWCPTHGKQYCAEMLKLDN